MKNKEKAFSLIEVVMALAILGIAILPILSMYPGALKMTTKATTNEEWSRVSMSIVDYVKSRGYDGIESKLSSEKFDNEYEFIFDSGTNSYKQDTFAVAIGISPSAFVINTKGIKLSDYKFTVYMEKENPSYAKLDLSKNQIVPNSTNSSIIYGIVKIRKKTDVFTNELARDSKFIITPIEKWKE